MQLQYESDRLDDYLLETAEVDYTHPIITATINKLFNVAQTEMEKVKVAFVFVRDDIAHSWDIQSTRVTCKASDVLTYQEGICYAKSNLLAALLRSQGIATGFCYQRLMLFDTPEKGYSIHALNAIYLETLQKWIRLDARGNKTGIDAQFSIDEEKLAFAIQEEFDEKDYPFIYVKPHPITMTVLEEHIDALEMYKYHLPQSI